MTRILWLATLLLGFGTVSLAQPPPAPTSDGSSPGAQVQNWYRRFLGRNADHVGLRAWSEQLRSGGDERDVLLQILGGGEYFWRAGSTNDGFVRTLWMDLTGEVPDERLARESIELINQEGRERAARALLEQAAAGHGNDVEVKAAEWRALVDREAEGLSTSIERLAEDVVVELAGRTERMLYQEIEGFLLELDRFQRLIHSSASPPRLQEEFRDIDERLHQLATNVRGLGSEHPALLLRVSDVLRADRRMHAVVFSESKAQGDSRSVLVRQATLLGDEVNELRRTAIYALPDARGSEALVGQLDALTQSVDHLVASINSDVDADHLRRDAAEVSRDWNQTVELINELPPRGHFFLRRTAQRVDAVVDRIEALLEVDAVRSRPYLP